MMFILSSSYFLLKDITNDESALVCMDTKTINLLIENGSSSDVLDTLASVAIKGLSAVVRHKPSSWASGQASRDIIEPVIAYGTAFPEVSFIEKCSVIGLVPEGGNEDQKLTRRKRWHMTGFMFEENTFLVPSQEAALPFNVKVEEGLHLEHPLVKAETRRFLAYRPVEVDKYRRYLTVEYMGYDTIPALSKFCNKSLFLFATPPLNSRIKVGKPALDRLVLYGIIRRTDALNQFLYKKIRFRLNSSTWSPYGAKL